MTMTLHVDARIAIDVVGRDGFGFSTVRLVGEATDANPARLVLLRRHSDMADETSPVDARADVERRAEEVARILDHVVPRATQSHMAVVIENAQVALQEGGTYYSVVVAVITASHVTAAGIGDVSGQLWVNGRTKSILNPTAALVGGTRVLTSALGKP